MPMRRGPVTAEEAISQLHADPDWMARRSAKEADREIQRKRLACEEVELVADLQAVGYAVSSVWDLVNTTEAYPQAIPILISHFARPYSDKIREGIARALAMKDARRFAWDEFLGTVKSGSLSEPVADGVMAAIAAMAGPTDLNIIVDLICDRSLGPKRVFLVRLLMRSRRPEVRETLLSLANDPDLSAEIAARMRSRRPQSVVA